MTSVAEVLVKSLKQIGVKYVFGVPSGNWVDYLDAIQKEDGIEFILISNESSGGFMADVCWRLTGTIAACFGTFGPGACNLTTGVCGGYLDRSPMLAFTDEMNDQMLGRVTQMNIDHQTLFKPITKWTTRLSKDKIQETIFKAHNIATSEVPGPIHIGLPAGIGIEECTEEDSIITPQKNPSTASDTELDKMLQLFSQSEKPVVALGITALRSGIRELVLDFLEKYQIPAVLAPMAKGLVPEDNSWYAGVLAHALANNVGEIHQQADLILGIGYDPIEINYEDWMPNVPLIHIDTAEVDLDRSRFEIGANVVGDIKYTLQKLLDSGFSAKQWDKANLEQHKNELFAGFTPISPEFGPVKALEILRNILPKDGIMTCDVGAHLHLIGQQWKTYSPECQLMTNGCSSMGFAIPAAIAAKLSCPDKAVCCVVGDGGFYMTAGELATASRLGLNIVFVVLNDADLSLIKIKQQNKGNPEYGVELSDVQKQDREDTSIFGIPHLKVSSDVEFEEALKAGFAAEGPVVIEAFIDPSDYDKLVLKGNKP